MAPTDIRASQEAGAAMPATPPRENLIRTTTEIGLTRSAGTSMPTLTGHFAKWNEWTEIRSAYEGNFMERFDASSMNKTLGEGAASRIKVLYDHGQGPMRNMPLGPIERIEPDAQGAYYAVPLLDTSYNRDLLPGLEAGLYGASFRFSVMQENVTDRPKRSEFNPRGISERTVTEAKVMEFGPVTFPAYAGATAGVRSLTDEFLLERFMGDEAIVEQLAARLAKKQTVSVYFGDRPQRTEPIVNVEPIEPNVILRDIQDLEPELSAATTPTEPGLVEPEPSAATTRAVTPNKGLFTNREEKPEWLL